MVSKLYKNGPRGFIIPEFVENDTSFVFLAHNVLEVLNFLFFKMADSSHLGFKDQDSQNSNIIIHMDLQCHT